MMFKIYQEESGHQIYVRCQMFPWRARAVSRMDSYIILITKLLEDIVAKETEDASTVKIFSKWVHARLLSANVHKHFHLCVHFYFVCISIVIQHFFFACISIVLQHFFVHAFLLCSTFLLYSNTFCMHFYCFLALAACISIALGCCWGPCRGIVLA